MNKLFYISFEEGVPFALARHIQYNIRSRLFSGKRSAYRRIDLLLSSSVENIEITWNDQRSANIVAPVKRTVLGDLTLRSSILEIYKIAQASLVKLWAENDWDSQEIFTIFSKIEEDDFRVSFLYKKPSFSKENRIRAELICSLYPSFGDYSLRFAKGKLPLVEIFFLKGFPDPDSIFEYFSVQQWKSESLFSIFDFNKEIFFLFDIKAGTCSVELRPIYNTKEQLEKCVQIFQSGGLPDPRDISLRDVRPDKWIGR